MRLDPFRELDRWANELMGTTRAPRLMPMDAYRLDDKYVLRFDLPGVDTDAIEVTAERNTLTVKARRGVESPEGAEFVVDERPSGTYARQVVLGDGLDVESVQADCHNGVLTVTIPVAEKAKPRRIAVGRGGFGDQKVIEGSTSERTAST
ncbi:Hsp20/alpha crystallin family protein [Hamadaea sp. NPDC050747]|uniref:Hsp20/alpha crystallin family protein n=1 Tax=Hamadaea sp. NPDC050747 TaxID=3155789 RepID=UPI0033F0D0DE